MNNPIRYTDPTGNACRDDGYCVIMPGDRVPNQSKILPVVHPVYAIRKPIIISRSEWGAKDAGSIERNKNAGFDETPYSNDNPDGYMPLSKEHPDESLASIYTTIIIHHDGMGNINTVQQLQFAQQSDGWWDITYHYIIDQSGNIYEGRPIDVRGAHVERANTGKIGVVLLGDFNEKEPTAEQKQAAGILVNWLDEKYGINQVIGHNQVDPLFGTTGNGTDCPGIYAAELVDYLGRLVR